MLPRPAACLRAGPRWNKAGRAAPGSAQRAAGAGLRAPGSVPRAPRPARPGSGGSAGRRGERRGRGGGGEGIIPAGAIAASLLLFIAIGEEEEEERGRRHFPAELPPYPPSKATRRSCRFICNPLPRINGRRQTLMGKTLFLP